MFDSIKLNYLEANLISKKQQDSSCPSASITELAKSINLSGEYVYWLLNRYTTNSINRWEDINARAIPAIKKFNILKKKKLNPPLPVRDINHIKTLSQLEDIVDIYDTSSGVIINKEIQNSFFTSKQATLIYNENNIKVIIPHTKEASIYFGANTKWCTAIDGENNKFSNYETLYIVIIGKEKYQFDFKTNQFMDYRDNPINPNELAKKYSDLWDIFEPIAIENKHIVFVKNPSEAAQMAAVKQNGYAIRYIKNPSEAVQMAAVKQNGYAIRYIKNPSEAVQMAAVQQDGWAICYIHNPSEALQMAAVQQNGKAIEYIKNPSEAVQMAAVQQDGYAIKFIDNPSEAVQLAAVQKDGWAICYIHNPSEAVQMAAVKQNGKAIKYIKNPSKAVRVY